MHRVLRTRRLRRTGARRYLVVVQAILATEHIKNEPPQLILTPVDGMAQREPVRDLDMILSRYLALVVMA